MTPYGEKRHRPCASDYRKTRGNRGRNRTSAAWWNRAKTPRRRSTSLRHYHAAARREGREHIEQELHLMWLDQELHREVTRQLRYGRSVWALRYLQAVTSDSEVADLEREVREQLQYEQYMIELYYELREKEDREYYWDRGYDDCECCRDQDYDLWSGDDDPTPDEAAWVDLWVRGAVNTPCDSERTNIDLNYCFYEDELYWTQFELDQKLAHVDPKLRADHDRNTERRRAGERHYRQNKRTVRK